MIIPQILIHKAIKGFLDLLKTDYTAAVDKSKSLIYHFTGALEFGRFNFSNESVALFLRQNTHERHVEVVLGYDSERHGRPTIHVSLGSENQSKNTIGAGTIPQIVDLESGTYLEKWGILNNSVNVVFSSENSFEVVLLYEVIKIFLMSYSDRMALAGLHNIKVSGQDLQLDPNIASASTFHRVLSVSSEYEVQGLLGRHLSQDAITKLMADVQLDTDLTKYGYTTS